MVLTLLLIVTFNTNVFVLCVFSWRCVRGLTSHATANEPTVDALLYFVTFLFVGFMYNECKSFIRNSLI